MSLEDTEKELEKQLEEALKAENEEELPEQEPEEKVEDESPEEEPKEEPKDDPKDEPKDEVVDNANAARLRREAAAERKKREELEARIAELEAPKTEEVKEQEIPAALQEIIEDHNRSKAWNEVQGYESAVRAKHKDYDVVSGAYSASIAQSYKFLNPDLSDSQIVEMTKKRVLDEIADLYKAGHDNPTEELYLRAKERGIRGPKEEPEKVVNKPDMAKLAANRAKSAGLAAASGESKGNPTPKYVAEEYTAADIAKMSDAEFKAVMAQIKE